MAGLATNVSGSMKMNNIANIIGVMFMSRTYAHMAHLKTSSFAKHKALNEFYDEVVDKADELAEAAQGMVGKLDIPFINMEGAVLDPITALTGHLSRIEGYASTCKEEYLKNIFQEIQALYRKTLYLMKELD
jgi:hypothetical protein